LPDHYDHSKIEPSHGDSKSNFRVSVWDTGIRAPICLLRGKIVHVGAGTVIMELRGLAFVMRMVDSSLDQSAVHRAKSLSEAQSCIAYRQLVRTKSVLMSNGVDVPFELHKSTVSGFVLLVFLSQRSGGFGRQETEM